MVYGDECYSRPTLYKWIERLEEGWNTYEDSVIAVRQKLSVLRSNVQLIERILDEVQVRVEKWDPKSSIHRITQDELEMTRVVAQWVPKPLPEEQSENGRESQFTEVMEKREKCFIPHRYYG